jgi:hypothetical protein
LFPCHATEKSDESSESINEKLPVVGLIILLLLVGQFDSMRRPAISIAPLRQS